MISESTHKWLCWTCSHFLNCQCCIACLSNLLHLLPLFFLQQKSLDCLGVCHSLSPHYFLSFLTNAWSPDAETFPCGDTAALPSPGQRANTSEQAMVEAWEVFYVLLQLDCGKEVEVSEIISVSQVKMIVAQRDWGCQNQTNKKVSLKALLVHRFDRCATPH